MQTLRKSISISLPIFIIVSLISFGITLFSIDPSENVTKTSITGIKITNVYNADSAETLFSIDWQFFLSFLTIFTLTWIAIKVINKNGNSNS